MYNLISMYFDFFGMRHIRPHPLISPAPVASDSHLSYICYHVLWVHSALMILKPEFSSKKMGWTGSRFRTTRLLITSITNFKKKTIFTLLNGSSPFHLLLAVQAPWVPGSWFVLKGLRKSCSMHLSRSLRVGSATRVYRCTAFKVLSTETQPKSIWKLKILISGTLRSYCDWHLSDWDAPVAFVWGVKSPFTNEPQISTNKLVLLSIFPSTSWRGIITYKLSKRTSWSTNQPLTAV